MMNKKIFNTVLLILVLTASRHILAHGVGSGSSYEFDKRDYAAEHAAKKKAAEHKKDQADWAEFMKAVNAPKKKESENVSDDHAHHGGTDIE